MRRVLSSGFDNLPPLGPEFILIDGIPYLTGSLPLKWVWMDGFAGYGNRVWVSMAAPLPTIMFLKSISKWGYPDKHEGCAISFELKTSVTYESVLMNLDGRFSMNHASGSETRFAFRQLCNDII